jgi:hypothetical protein
MERCSAPGVLYGRCEGTGFEYLVVPVTQPGRLIDRCLVGWLHEMLVDLDALARRALVIDRLSFDPILGGDSAPRRAMGGGCGPVRGVA